MRVTAPIARHQENADLVGLMLVIAAVQMPRAAIPVQALPTNHLKEGRLVIEAEIMMPDVHLIEIEIQAVLIAVPAIAHLMEIGVHRAVAIAPPEIIAQTAKAVRVEVLILVKETLKVVQNMILQEKVRIKGAENPEAVTALG